jgi:hypothetical protein
MVQIAVNYIGVVAGDTQELAPNHTYHFDKNGAFKYSSPQDVPDFIQNE